MLLGAEVWEFLAKSESNRIAGFLGWDLILMLQSFKNKMLEDIFKGKNTSRSSRRRRVWRGVPLAIETADLHKR